MDNVATLVAFVYLFRAFFRRKRFPRKLKVFKNASTQTEFCDLYPDFMETCSIDELPFNISSDEESNCSVGRLHILPDYMSVVQGSD